MQATVATFDGEDRTGTVLTDAGIRLPFGATAFAVGRLRGLRVGQRVAITVEDDTVTALWIPTMPPPDFP